MAEHNQNPTESDPRVKAEVLARVKEVDEKLPSPSKRAEKIWAILRQHDELTTWDVLCFCCEWLGLMIPVWDWLFPEAKELAVKLNKIHYWRTDDIFLSERSIKFQDQRGIKVDTDG